MSDTLTQFDRWLEDDEDDGKVSALIMRQWLEPIEGKDGIVFPPTYAKPERMREEDWPGYNIDCFPDGSSICQIDSVGSQANRMEPIFKREPYKKLVPQVVVMADEREVHLLDAGHRAADAIVRFSTLGPRLDEAFRAYKYKGDAESLARIAPTSIVFGAWDSRATQVKLPRIVRSVIRAYNVKRLHRSAQYSTIAGEILEGGDAEVTTKGPKAELGLAHVPAAWTHGGIQVFGDIRRDGALNLSALRVLTASSGIDATRKLRRYILGLALVAFTATPESFLREGCQLVPDTERPSEWQLVRNCGEREKLAVSHPQALAFASAAAVEFGVEEGPLSALFEAELAKQVMALAEKDRKELLKEGAVTSEALKKLKGAKKGGRQAGVAT